MTPATDQGESSVPPSPWRPTGLSGEVGHAASRLSARASGFSGRGDHVSETFTEAYAGTCRVVQAALWWGVQAASWFPRPKVRRRICARSLQRRVCPQKCGISRKGRGPSSSPFPLVPAVPTPPGALPHPAGSRASRHNLTVVAARGTPPAPGPPRPAALPASPCAPCYPRLHVPSRPEPGSRPGLCLPARPRLRHVAGETLALTRPRLPKSNSSLSGTGTKLHLTQDFHPATGASWATCHAAGAGRWRAGRPRVRPGTRP